MEGGFSGVISKRKILGYRPSYEKSEVTCSAVECLSGIPSFQEHLPPSGAEFKSDGAIPPLPHTSSGYNT
jgi:hypothetical protein